MSNNKRLERDPQNKVIGGVCSGLGNYFGMDAIFWRVLFFFLFFAGLSGLLIYVILWIVMPAGKMQPHANVYTPGNESVPNDQEPQKNSGSMVAGLVLIGIGALTLIARYIPQINWHTAWPVALIVVGLLLIIPKNKKS